MALRTVRIVEHPQALSRLLNGPEGGVARDLARRAVQVTNQAKRNASGRPGPRVDTGRLRSSIAWELRTANTPLPGFAAPTGGGGIFARVGTNVEYALPLEKGLRNGARYPFLGPALSAARL